MKKLAELFEVEVDYIWRGTPATDTPDLSRPDVAAAELGDVLREIKDQLAQQTQVLEEIKTYAEAAKTMLEAQRELKVQTDEQFRQWTLAIADRTPEASPQGSPQAPPKTGAAKTKRAARSRTP